MGENVALIILRLRLLKEGAVLSESLLSQVRRSLSLFKGPLEIKLPKTNPGDHSGSCGGSGSSEEEEEEESWSCGSASAWLGSAQLDSAQLPFIKQSAAEEGGQAPALPARCFAHRHRSPARPEQRGAAEVSARELALSPLDFRTIRG